MENLTHEPSEEWNLGTEKLIPHKCLIYRRLKLIHWPMNIGQESLFILQPMNLLLEFLLDLPHCARLAYKHSLPQALHRLLCSLLQHQFPKLQFFCYSWINSISGHLNLPQFTSLFKLTHLSNRYYGIIQKS